VSEIFARLPLESCFTLFPMHKIIIAVGSKRGPKLNAVTEALQSFSFSLGHDSEFEVVRRGSGKAASAIRPRHCDELYARRLASRGKLLFEMAAESGALGNTSLVLEGGLAVVHEGASTDERGISKLRQNGHRRVLAWKRAYVSMACEVITAVREASRSPQHWPAEVLENGVELASAIDRFRPAPRAPRTRKAPGACSRPISLRAEAFRVAVYLPPSPISNYARCTASAAASWSRF